MNIADESGDFSNNSINAWEDFVARDSQYYINLELERKKLAEEYYDHPVYQLEYCDSLMFNGKFQEALDIVIPLYKKLYSKGFGVGHIIKCLTALGKDYKEFDWIVPPVILHLDSSLLDLCTKILSDDFIFSVAELYETLLMNHSDYMMFNQGELAIYLKQHSDRFIVRDLSDPHPFIILK